MPHCPALPHCSSHSAHLGAPRDVGGRVGAPSGLHTYTSGLAADPKPHGVRPSSVILEGRDANSAYDPSEYAGVGSRFLGPGEPGQRKWHIADDFVMTRPVADISDFVGESEAAYPSAG